MTQVLYALTDKYCRMVATLVFLMVLTIHKIVYPQAVKLDHIEFTNNQVVVHYDLLDSVQGRSFTIRVYTSKDNFLNPLEKISGDVGLEVRPGPNKKVTWDIQQEFGADYEGKVAIEIRGRIFIPFINLDPINQYKVFKRKREYPLTWSGGSPQNILNFDLYHGVKKVTTYPNLANVGHHTFEFPSHIKPGNTYRFMVGDAKNKDEVVFSDYFRIRRKIPLIVKAIPLAGLLTGLVYLISNKDQDDSLDAPPPFPNQSEK